MTDDPVGRLRAGEEHFAPGPLRDALRFLLREQNPDKGWASHRGLPLDLRITAEVVTALRLFKEDAADMAAGNAAVTVQDHSASATALHELTSLVMIANADGGDGPAPPGDRLADRLAEREPSTSALAQALLAAEPWRDRGLARPWMERLLGRQQSDGSWSAAGDPQGSPVATAWAVRALQAWLYEPDAARAAERGLARLRSVLREHGWDSPALSGTYALCAVLRAMATGAGRDDGLCDEGLERLWSSQRPDGGWGGGPDEPSNAEHTAVAVLALAEFDSFRFVPLRSARRALGELTAALSAAEERSRASDVEIDARVEERAKQILADRNRLRKEVARQERIIASLSGAEARPTAMPYVEMSKNLTLISRASKGIESPHFALAVIATAAFATFLAFQNTEKESDPAYAIIFTILSFFFTTFALSISIAIFRQIASSRRSKHPSSASQHLLKSFMEATSKLPPSQREDLTYELTAESAGLPVEFTERRLLTYIARRNFLPETMGALSHWIDEYLSASDQTREGFLERLREAGR